jgi:hypothetical protein
MSWENFINFIKDGEPVSAGTPNRPLQQLDQNLRYLWDVIQASALGSTVYARRQTVDSTVEVGQPVYFNSTTSQFEAAYATANSDFNTGYLIIPEQAQVWGLVSNKLNSTLADILLFGYAKLDLSAAVGDEANPDGSVPAGTWYLSNKGTGQLTKSLPPINIPVCKTNDNGEVYVNPKFNDFLENHRHYVFSLTMLPAGDVAPPPVGTQHEISNANASLPGWLPANDPVFNGTAPAGAKFGYNLTQDPALKNLYPPIPLQSVCVIMQRPSVYEIEAAPRRYGQELLSDTVKVDNNGIWWMTDCYDEVPWPTLLDTGSQNSVSAGNPAYWPCGPELKDYSLKLYFTKVGFATDISTVTSLNSTDDRVVITCVDNQANTGTGDLLISLNLEFMSGEENVRGKRVIKEFNPATNTFDFGFSCEGVYATSPNVLLSGDSQNINGNQVFQGIVGLGVLSSSTKELSSQLVRLDGVTEESFPVLYLGMPRNNTTSYVVKFEVPGDAPETSNFQLRLRLLGRSAGTLPPLAASYYTVSRPPAGLTTPVNVTQNYTVLPITTGGTVAANQAVEALSTAFSVAPGDIVYIKVQRTPSDPADAYTGEVGVMQQIGVLTSS